MQTTDRQLQLLVQLHQVYDRVAHAVDLATFFQAVVEALRDVFAYSLVSIHWREDDVLVAYHHVGFESPLLRIPLTKGLVGRVARTGQPALIPDVRLEPEFISSGAAIRSEVAVPLFDQGQVVGVLNVESMGEHILCQDDLQLLIVLGRYISLRLEALQLVSALRRSEQRYRNFVENFPGIVYRCANDANWTEELISNNAFKITGYPGTDFYHNAVRSFADITHPEDRGLVRETIACAIAERRPFDIEYRIIHADGTIRWVFERGQAIFANPGEVDRLEGIILDITDYKQVTNAWRASEERNRALLQAIPDLMFLKTKEGVYIDYHASNPDDLLVPPEAFLGKHISEVMPPELVEQFIPLYKRAKQTGELQTTEYTLPMNQSPRWFEARIAPCGEDKLLTIIRDITERKQAELLRIQHTKEVEALNRMKDEFLASMSHEFRTPLTTVMTLSESLQEGIYGGVTQSQHRVLEAIQRSGNHLLTMINDVLDVAKIESSKLALDIVPVSVQDICDSSLQLVREDLLKKRLKLFQIFDHTIYTIRADHQRLVQILVNLLSNAIKFTPEGGKIGLEVERDPTQSAVHFIVWDTGIGIAPEDQERIFQPFIQLDSSLARRYEGTGLGLALVQRLTKLHGGSVTLESALGKGSRFAVTLPWVEAPNGYTMRPLPPLPGQRGAAPIEGAKQLVAITPGTG
ncbi:MAG: ATP-binding protein [Caldilineaceae bacterium]